MKQKILELEKIARQLETTQPQRNNWNQKIQKYADDFLNDINESNAYDFPVTNGKGILDIPFENSPKEIDGLLTVIRREVDKEGINPASGKHFGYIPGGGVFPTAMGDYLAAVTNRYAGVFFANPGSVRIENQLIRWMCEMVGYPKEALGNLASGGSVATLTAIVTARDFKTINSTNILKSVIYITEQVHHCVNKAFRIAGLAEAQIRIIPMDDEFRMDADFLEVQVRIDKNNGLNPFLVVASAGTTDVGAVDPLDRVADIAEEYNLWFHVDAAYGGFFLLADVDNEDGTKLKSQFEGIHRSDSLVIDPHKGLFLAYGLGAVLIKNVEAQMKAHLYQASYMQDALEAVDELSPADLSPELTKHFRGMRMWLPLQLFGVAPFKASLEEKILLARYFYNEVQKIGFEVGGYPQLSVVTYRYIPKSGDANEFNKKLVEFIQKDGRCFVSSTTIDGEFWLRLAVLVFRSHLEHIDLFLEILKEGIEELEKI